MKKIYCQPEIQLSDLLLEQTIMSTVNTSGNNSADMKIVNADSDLWG